MYDHYYRPAQPELRRQVSFLVLYSSVPAAYLRAASKQGCGAAARPEQESEAAEIEAAALAGRFPGTWPDTGCQVGLSWQRSQVSSSLGLPSGVCSLILSQSAGTHLAPAA